MGDAKSKFKEENATIRPGVKLIMSTMASDIGRLSKGKRVDSSAGYEKLDLVDALSICAANLDFNETENLFMGVLDAAKDTTNHLSIEINKNADSLVNMLVSPETLRELHQLEMKHSMASRVLLEGHGASLLQAERNALLSIHSQLASDLHAALDRLSKDHVSKTDAIKERHEKARSRVKYRIGKNVRSKYLSGVDAAYASSIKDIDSAYEEQKAAKESQFSTKTVTEGLAFINQSISDFIRDPLNYEVENGDVVAAARRYGLDEGLIAMIKELHTADVILSRFIYGELAEEKLKVLERTGYGRILAEVATIHNDVLNRFDAVTSIKDKEVGSVSDWIDLASQFGKGKGKVFEYYVAAWEPVTSKAGLVKSSGILDYEEAVFHALLALGTALGKIETTYHTDTMYNPPRYQPPESVVERIQDEYLANWKENAGIKFADYVDSKLLQESRSETIKALQTFMTEVGSALSLVETTKKAPHL